MEPLKKRFLELLDKDLEFRYAVAGYLGLSEILKRLDNLSEEQIKLREEQTKIWQEIRGLREGADEDMEGDPRAKGGAGQPKKRTNKNMGGDPRVKGGPVKTHGGAC